MATQLASPPAHTSRDRTIFRWSYLPNELKIIIVDNIPSASAYIAWKNHPFYARLFLRTMLLANRDLHDLTISAYTKCLHTIKEDIILRYPEPVFAIHLTTIRLQIWPIECKEYFDDLNRDIDAGRKSPIQSVKSIVLRGRVAEWLQRATVPMTSVDSKLTLPNLTSMTILVKICLFGTCKNKTGHKYMVEGFNGAAVFYGPRDGDGLGTGLYFKVLEFWNMGGKSEEAASEHLEKTEEEAIED